MKKILVPVDFSLGSINAFEYAIEIANKIEADLRVVHVMTGKNYPITIAEQIGKVTESTVEDCMEILLGEKRGRYHVPNGKLDYKVRTGNVVKEISNQAKYDDAMLIVVGTHGVSGFEDNWIGSNSYRLVSHCPCPVLTIRNEFRFSGVHRVILPIDITPGSRLKVPAAAGFAKVFNSDIFVVGLRESSYEFIFNRIRNSVKQVQKYLEKELDVTVKTDMLSGKNIVDQLIAYSKEKEGDVIVVHLMHSANTFDYLVNYNANRLVNQSYTPVLFIPTKE